MAGQPEAWLRGPVAGVPDAAMPAVHALLQAAEDLQTAAVGLTGDELWARPGGAASVGFHLRHIAGSTDRLLTYARGAQLDDAQRAAAAAEGRPAEPDETATALVERAQGAIGRAIEELRAADPLVAEPREVGRGRLPSTRWGILFHIAEHTQRHVGQVITTAKVVRGLGEGA